MTFRQYQLKMRPNNLLVAPRMKTVVRGDTEQVIDTKMSSECHYIHVEDDLVAAISHCTDSDVVGSSLWTFFIHSFIGLFFF